MHGRRTPLQITRAVVAYGEGLVERVREAVPGVVVDAALDAAGFGALPDLIALRGSTTDRVVTITDPTAAEHGVPFSAIGEPSAEALAEHARAVTAGELRVAVAQVLPLSETGKARDLSETGHARGKLVLVP